MLRLSRAKFEMGGFSRSVAGWDAFECRVGVQVNTWVEIWIAFNARICQYCMFGLMIALQNTRCFFITLETAGGLLHGLIGLLVQDG